ncbi:GGDEF domain-containing protein [Paenibacillus harenae]|uniref:GGDEF domain-containing protein n=1 Tax=Paenibacillus harenae TaxID=306543 RepID=UPI0003F98A75|nr:GGDEF domain-containing protein [Paenibacillus harenae]
MDEVGFGLFNRELIRRMKKHRQDGGIGVIHVRSRPGFPAAEAAIKNWENGESAMFWRQQLEAECFYFLRKLKDEPIQASVEKAAERLKSRLQQLVGNEKMPSYESWSVGAAVGIAVAHSISTGYSAETDIYRLLLEAAESGKRNEATCVIRDDAAAMRLDNARAAADLTSEGSQPRTYRPELQGRTVRIGELANPVPLFPPQARVSEIAYLFDADARTQAAVIVDHGRPVGILMKEKLHQMLAGQFGLPLYWNRPVERIMNGQPLIVDEQLPVEQVSQLAMASDFSQLYDVVLITKNGQLTGAASLRSILECITALRTEAARGANPLTGLPGNEEIQRELERRIELGLPFAVIYADLDYFKWYNDCFGFVLGDDLIRYLADVLRKEQERLGSGADFTGHIGGDDFIAVTGADRAELLCRSVIERFDSGIKAFYGGVEVTTCRDRHGHIIQQEGVSLSLSLMLWDGEVPVTTEYISRFSAMLKKQAKARKGSTYVMDHITGAHHREERL